MNDDFSFALSAINILPPIPAFYKVHMRDKTTVVLTVWSIFFNKTTAKRQLKEGGAVFLMCCVMF